MNLSLGEKKSHDDHGEYLNRPGGDQRWSSLPRQVSSACCCTRAPALLPTRHPCLVGAIAFVTVCLLLIGFEHVRDRAQGLVTRTLFKRSDMENIEGLLRGESRSAVGECSYVDFACTQIARYVVTDDFSIKDSVPSQLAGMRAPLPLLERSQWQSFEAAPWAQPSVVIVTAYDQYAIEAFEAGAIDYLLKPLGQERLAQAVDRVRGTISRKPEVAESLARLQEIADLPSESRTRKVVGRAGEDYFLLNVHEVYAFQAEGELVWIITANKKYLSTQTLRILQERLQTTTFRRIHRNALVNMDHVRKMTH